MPPLGDVRLKPCMPRPAPPVVSSARCTPPPPAKISACPHDSRHHAFQMLQPTVRPHHAQRSPDSQMPLTTAETVGVVGEACEEGPSLVLDPRAGSDWADLVSLRRAVASALKATLLPRGQALITEQFNKSPHLVFQCGLTAAKVQQLVEHNPAVAIEVLRLLTEEAPRRGARSLVDEWLGELVSGDMSLHSMEVVNCLASAGTLPQDMLRRFVSNCISQVRRFSRSPLHIRVALDGVVPVGSLLPNTELAADGISPSANTGALCRRRAPVSVSQCERVDERRQTRLVRLVCVFLRTLIKTRAVDVEGLFVEVQAFCIEFARFRDAASLYRLLKASSPSLSPRNAP